MEIYVNLYYSCIEYSNNGVKKFNKFKEQLSEQDFLNEYSIKNDKKSLCGVKEETPWYYYEWELRYYYTTKKIEN